MSKLEKYALVSEGLIHFTLPNGVKLYEDKLDDAGDIVDDEDKPIGVFMIAPGSKDARAVETEVATLARERIGKLKGRAKEQGLTPEHLNWLLTEKAARMVTRFSNFSYKGMESGVDNVRAFLQDPKYQHFADQVRAATADYDVFMSKDAAS